MLAHLVYHSNRNRARVDSHGNNIYTQKLGITLPVPGVAEYSRQKYMDRKTNLMLPAPTADQKFTLIFDWGKTLMKVFPQYAGPMCDWPEAAAVDGVVEALERLLHHYPMVVATNATDSGAEQVWKSLHRVGLGEYFRAVFTTRELEAKKPEPAFFNHLESILALPAHQMVMVGDDFRVDVTGAKSVGWQAIWYNPDRQPATGLLPLHDAEVQDMRALPDAIQRLSLPDYSTCLAWLLERGTPYNILAHIHLVAAAAYQLSVWLGAAGAKVDPILTHRGAMLHDLAKIDSIRQNKERGHDGDHAAMAFDLLMERGQPELAEIANRHMPYSNPDDPRRPITWEQRLVHYADKLAEGSRLVSIDERLQALKQRYPQFAGQMMESWPVLGELQQEICGLLNVTPVQLIARLRSALGEF
jgi:phosphoglycolate phosphatase-like HAD superfamily hydrolase